MYAVIFEAEINELDKGYYETAKRMRDLATTYYGCKGFRSTCEGNKEIAISYWENLEDITIWKQNEEHMKAQEEGKSRWYKSFHVYVVEVLCDYSYGT